MKKKLYVFLLMFVIAFYSCQNQNKIDIDEIERPAKTEDDSGKKDDSTEIDDVGKEDESIDFYTTWIFSIFGYTSDGNDINDVSDSVWAELEALVPTTLRANRNLSLLTHKEPSHFWLFQNRNLYRVEHSITQNSIKISSVIAITYVNPLPDELKIASYIEKAHSFDIKDDELLLRFNGEENVNLLIFKKQKE